MMTMLNPVPEASEFVATSPVIRQPSVDEVADILALFASEVRLGLMLPRDPAEVTRQVADWRVAVVDGAVVGCVSLVFFNNELCELRSLAVSPDYRRRGIASGLVRAAVHLARDRGMQRVLTLTRSTRLFERNGFGRDQVQNFPEKVWRDCEPCPLKECCDEVALVFEL